ncbi:hypothetical protein [Leptospira noguchii]|uniref:hypothetical protein n=1 Tax=Leptospira noguchii TaxID=28182 RepID=UPI000774402A|nr:hypothetical protein [Leptospira noguchii]
MKRLLALFLILSFVSCASYSEKVEKNKTDLDQVEQTVLDSDDIPKKDKDFIKETLSQTKKLLDKGVSESVLADKWRNWIFNKWLYISLFVLTVITLLVLKVKSWVSWIPNFSIFNSGDQKDARSTT